MDNVLREQLRVLSLLDNFPHRVIEKIENRDGEQQENFALFKQIINALLLIRLHSRSRKNFLKSSQSADSLPIENTEDFEKSSQSVGALEAARAAAAATKKTTFKNKRRRSIQDPGSRYQHALYSSHYGVAIQPEAKVQYLDSNPQSSFQQILPSNLHKLAALLGKAKK